MIRCSNQRGIGLISVVVSIAILSIALTMATSTFFSASRLTRQAADMTRASNYAEGVMERVTAQPYASVRSTQITAGLPNLPQAKCLVDVSVPEDGLKQVVVTCTWLQGGRQRSTRFSTLVARGGAR